MNYAPVLQLHFSPISCHTLTVVEEYLLVGWHSQSVCDELGDMGKACGTGSVYEECLFVVISDVNID